MFKFAFSSGNAESKINVKDVEAKQDAKRWFESEEITPGQIIVERNTSVNSVQFGECTICYISDKDVIHNLQNVNDSVVNAEQGHSDLISAVYEGGLKIWECTFDLLEFLIKENIDFNNKKVLDLGCGVGILGIFSCLNGARTVFQDYNNEVIKFATIPNVYLNKISFDQCKFYCGDWQSFLNRQNELDQKGKFDYILTSETIYNTDNYTKILEIFKHLLQDNGIIYLAAKYNYFGVGGSIGQFKDLLKKEDIFNCTTCWACADGLKRAIIKITFK